MKIKQKSKNNKIELLSPSSPTSSTLSPLNQVSGKLPSQQQAPAEKRDKDLFDRSIDLEPVVFGNSKQKSNNNSRLFPWSSVGVRIIELTFIFT